MSNGHVCCATGVCCPPGMRSRRVESLATILANGADVHAGAIDFANPTDEHRRYATIVLDHFDLMPKGSMEAMIEALRPMFARVKPTAGTLPAGADGNDDQDSDPGTPV